MNIILHSFAVIALIIRISFLYKAIKYDKSKIKFEILLMMLIIIVWVSIYYLLPLSKT